MGGAWQAMRRRAVPSRYLPRCTLTLTLALTLTPILTLGASPSPLTLNTHSQHTLTTHHSPLTLTTHHAPRTTHHAPPLTTHHDGLQVPTRYDGGNTARTSAKKKTLNPEWDETLDTLHVYDAVAPPHVD